MASSLRDDLASLKIDRHQVESREALRERRPQQHRDRDRNQKRSGIGVATILLWLIPLTLLGTAGGVAYQQYEKIKAKPEVTIGLVQTMTPGEAEKLLSAKGYLKSRHQAMIGATIPGRVERMYVEEGSKVKKGDVLAVLEHDDLKAILSSKKAMLKRNEAEVLEGRLDLKQKEREATRAARLYNQKTVAIEEIEKANAARDMASARVGAAEASMKLTESNIEETEEMIRRMHLFAPFDGTVVEKQGEAGEVITPSAMSASIGRSAVVSLANLNKMEVETDIAENLLSRVALGQPAEISVSAVPSMHYRGRLRQIIPMGDRSRGTIKVKVEILDPDEHLFPELVATVHFLPDKALNNPNANRAFLFVPKAAVIEESGHSIVWVVDGKSRISKRRVEVVVTTDDLTRVDTGLKEGETVILNPANTLRENTEVKISE
ncbi:efflux RND transporter periplasmic adaptor subunit [Singulisphaera acidiphila]|uniref:RND family efflux transporter, MFP subunit n=1 Tax=Singulisphaera acidiphila (strain ATCC BAA-1392 / DSM 18658 / VKM B-2454 / MOB10) TaxID=886293 RepID=L0DBT6_SINAD|nr:efflux RND transporter periplasmic adaptor subunit [Singulisphaera acidiphila]AGA26126.1 RND family efflux transporter, MFP subunit [Singulisphaera acidiphila DSM 18658]